MTGNSASDYSLRSLQSTRKVRETYRKQGHVSAMESNEVLNAK